MKEDILKKSGEIFLKYGVKSITMDDIANSLAISKKTIYKYFKNKEELIDETASFMHEEMHNHVLGVCNLGYNAIEENFKIKEIFKDMFQNLNDSPVFQLQKYYPKTYKKIMSNEFSMFKECISRNLEKGVSEGLYRKNIDIELSTKFYFSLVMSVHDSSMYTYNKNTINKLEQSVLEYHTRAIATLKGFKILEEQLAQNLIK
ncbi:TetR/AcrR family transcriptional regulator [Lutibacter flavus]|uniref:Transcriptional regulator, TetR family n=1 Tax=Lutibacter flavus TaxID=691689 RepID=A0A238YS70_9FLAO|nr:TetR/AcrR family transcriptional regulator [Lutibacter flavus]SNR73541.1 transcriptional regulator, TetR family [Lutibacter flavus]